MNHVEILPVSTQRHLDFHSVPNKLSVADPLKVAGEASESMGKTSSHTGKDPANASVAPAVLYDFPGSYGAPALPEVLLAATVSEMRSAAHADPMSATTVMRNGSFAASEWNSAFQCIQF